MLTSKLAWRELRRRPRAFVAPLGILVLLGVLLLYPAAVLDGIIHEATAALSHAPADLVVYSRDANGVVIRSRIDPPLRAQVEAVAGVEQAATLDVVLLTGRVAGHDEPVPFAVFASDQPIGDVVPGAGEVIADGSLRSRAGMDDGSEAVVGPWDVPVRTIGFTDDINFWFGNGLVVDRATWLALQGRAPPAGADPASDASQALLVTIPDDAEPETVAAAIDEATGGATETFTRSGAVTAMPGVPQQQATFGAIRMVTLGVALLVVGLYLSFVLLERGPLYAVLKAVGASSRQLFGTLLTQVTAIADISMLIATLIAWGITRLPLGIPARLQFESVFATAMALRTVAAIAAAWSLRRVVRVDPAEALG